MGQFFIKRCDHRISRGWTQLWQEQILNVCGPKNPGTKFSACSHTNVTQSSIVAMGESRHYFWVFLAPLHTNVISTSLLTRIAQALPSASAILVAALAICAHILPAFDCEIRSKRNEHFDVTKQAR